MRHRLRRPEIDCQLTSMQLTFLGTGGAWSLPELNCDCLICREMRLKHEKRTRTALLLTSQTHLLIDCGPDIASQLADQRVAHVDGVLITHEHGDHYMGMDELVSYKRTAPRGEFNPVPVYMTGESWKVIRTRFEYLTEMGVLQVHEITPLQPLRINEFEVTPFKTTHGDFAAGSVGYLIRFTDLGGRVCSLVYTSDFVDLPAVPTFILRPDILVIQSFWLNEPLKNVPRHMSFQRALDYIRTLQPRRETFLVHIGDGDPVPSDPANIMLKKRDPADPMRSPVDGRPYPVPRNQDQWQELVDRICSENGIPFKITVARDGLRVEL
ncbi:MAG: MBL fold metallo-hydrolase [Pseudomonadota bacterium]